MTGPASCRCPRWDSRDAPCQRPADAEDLLCPVCRTGCQSYTRYDEHPHTRITTRHRGEAFAGIEERETRG